MKLTLGAEAAWIVAAGEAAASGHEQIEPAHLLVGLFSLAKLGEQAERGGLDPASTRAVAREHEEIAAALAARGLDPTTLRRRARRALGRGPRTAPPTEALSRSPATRVLFGAAEALAAAGAAHIAAGGAPIAASSAHIATGGAPNATGGAPDSADGARDDEEPMVSCLHLLAALTDGVDPVTQDLLRDAGLEAGALREAGLAAGHGPSIGATAADSNRRGIEADPPLEGRFEKVPVPEPGRDETVAILRGLRSRFESRHEVTLGDPVLDAAVDLSIRFEPDRRLPDKAIDLVDAAAARTRRAATSLLVPPEAEAAAAPANAPAAAPAKGTAAAVPVTVDALARVLAEKRGLPLELVTRSLDGDTGSRLLELEALLRSRILGQDDALGRVARRLRLAYAGMQDRRGPLAVLLFLGPTGVGKTETARLLASHLFGSEDDLVRIEPLEFEDDGGRLTGALAARPHRLVLLDDVEKADPRVLDRCLNVFDTGRFTDSRGGAADARQAVFVLTSTLDPQAAAEPGRFFRPELMDRIDEIVPFRPLNGQDVARIVALELEDLAAAVSRRHGVRLQAEPEALAFLAAQAGLSGPGAREARATVDRLVKAPLSTLALSGKISRSPAWRLLYDEGGVYLLPD